MALNSRIPCHWKNPWMYNKGSPELGFFTVILAKPIKKVESKRIMSLSDTRFLREDLYKDIPKKTSLCSWITSIPTPEIKGLFLHLSLIHISEPTRLGMISYAVFCLKQKT